MEKPWLAVWLFSMMDLFSDFVRFFVFGDLLIKFSPIFYDRQARFFLSGRFSGKHQRYEACLAVAIHGNKDFDRKNMESGSQVPLSEIPVFGGYLGNRPPVSPW